MDCIYRTKRKIERNNRCFYRKKFTSFPSVSIFDTSLYLYDPMKFVLYKFLRDDGLPTILYVKGIYNGKPMFSRYAGDAKKYHWLYALFLSIWLSLSWVNVKYLKK